MRQRSFLPKSVLAAAVAVLIGVAYALWLWLPQRSAPTPGDSGAFSKPLSSASDERIFAREIEAVLGDARCRLHRGAGPARHAAAAVVRDDAAVRFVVLDRSGPMFAGKLPFPAERVLLGRRGDGALAAAFGAGDHARLTVLVDGELVADEHGALDFGLSRDGAQWFVVRRNPDGKFEVEQHDTAAGGRRMFRADWLYDTDAGLSHTGAYALVDNAIVFVPRVQDQSRENAHYVRTAQDRTRMVRLGSEAQTIVESDSHIYMLQKWHHRHGLSKRVFDWDAKGEDRVVQAWWRPLTVSPATVRLFRSDDGAWIGLFGWDLIVLDAATGERVLSLPVRGDKAAELARLGSVLGADATVRDVGQAHSARIAHGLLLVQRNIPSRLGRDAADHAATEEVVDVFRLADQRPDAGPEVRLAAEDVRRCLVDVPGFPLPRVRADADGFAYVPPGPDSGGFQPASDG